MKRLIAFRLLAELAALPVLFWLWSNGQPWAALHQLMARLAGQ